MKVKTTKRALLISGLALLLCVSMLVGSTFAWFSDSVTSKNNIIKAGNLDVVMEYQTVDPETGKLTEWTEVKENTSLFSDDALWEPGHTEYVLLRVRNAGTLALKYALKAEVYEEKQGTNVYNQKFNLSDYLMYGIVTEDDVDAVTADREAAVAAAVTELSSSMDVSGALEDLGLGNGWGQLIGSVNTERALLPGENNVTGLIITMPTTVGNEANYLTGTEAPYIKFGVNLYATQQMHEEDSFGDDYDEDSTYPEIVKPVYDAGTLNDALNNGQDVTLGEDLSFTGTESNLYGNSAGLMQNGGTFDGNGNELDITAKYGIVTSGGTIKNLLIDKTGVERGIVIEVPTQDVILDNVTIDGPGYAVNTSEYGDPDVQLIVKDSTINGWTSFAGLDSATFTNTTFGENTDGYWQDMGYDADYDRLIRPYVTTVFENCEFEESYYVDLSALAAGDTVTFINCTCDGVVLTADNYDGYITIENYNSANVLFPVEIDEGVLEAGTRNYYVSTPEGLQNVFAKVIPQNREQSQSVNLMNDIDLSGIIWEPIDNMHFTFNGNGHTISNVTCKEGWRSGFFSYAGGVTVNDLTLENVTASGSQVGIFAGSGEGFRAKNCYLKGDNTVNYYETEETWGGIGAITGVISGSTVNVEICEGATVTLNKNGIVSQAAYYNDLTGYLTANNGNVVNNGTIIYGIGTAADFLALGGKSLSGTYALTSDINLGGAAAATIGAAYGKELTIIGNGHTLSNATTAHTAHNGMKHHGLFYAYTNSKLTISDLVIENVNIDSTADTERNYGAAIVVAFADGGSTVTLNNVDVNDCKVLNNRADIGDEAGVYVGYQTGTLVMTDCDSTGCTVDGETTEKTGAMIGMVNGTATLTNCTTDLTIGTCNRVSGTLVEQ